MHLNPERAGLVDGGEIAVESYQWSSLVQAYAKSPAKRPDWIAVAETMDLFQNKDTAAGRRKFLEGLNEGVREEKGIRPVDEETIGERIKRGWFWGTESFKEAMLELYDTQAKTKSLKGNGVHQSSGLLKDHAEVSAKAILEAAVKHFGATRDELKVPIRGDMARAAVAFRIHQNTRVSQSWIANALEMKSAANVSRQIYVFRRIDDNTLAPKIRKWIKIKDF